MRIDGVRGSRAPGASPRTPGIFPPRRRTVAALTAALALSACLPRAAGPVADPQAYAPAETVIPFAVIRLLPRGVSAADVRVADNCYGYAYQGAVYPVLNPRGTQYCI